MNISYKDQDAYEQKMAQYTPEDIKSMSDEQVLGCANLIIEGEPVPGVTLNGVYFASREDAVKVAAAVVNRSHAIYHMDKKGFKEKYWRAQERVSESGNEHKQSWWDKYFALWYYVPLLLLLIIPAIYSYQSSNSANSGSNIDLNLDLDKPTGLPELPKSPAFPKLPESSKFPALPKPPSNSLQSVNDDRNKYESRSGSSAPYSYNYDVSGYGDLGYVYGNIDVQDKYGEGYIYTEEGEELWVQVEWSGYGVLEAYDENDNYYELEVD